MSTPGIWNLTGAVGQAFAKGNTRLESLMLARFEGTKITLRFTGRELAEAELKFKEVPYEVSGGVPADEVIGTTMGPLGKTATLWVFTVAYPGGDEVWRFTSFERDLNDGAHDYAAVGIEHDGVAETANLERQQVTFRVRHFLNNPVSLLVPFGLEWPLKVEIYEATVNGSAASNLQRWFMGEVTEASPEGPFIEATAQSLSYLFDRQIPRQLFQQGCNWTLFEARCGLLRANWLWRGTVSAWHAETQMLDLTGVVSQADPANGAGLPAHACASGYLYCGAGNAVQYRPLADNTALAGGAMSVVMALAFTAPPGVGSYVYFYPGCDGSAGRCAYFNNYANFGGFPFVPVMNPTTALTLPGLGGGGAKK